MYSNLTWCIFMFIHFFVCSRCQLTSVPEVSRNLPSHTAQREFQLLQLPPKPVIPANGNYAATVNSYWPTNSYQLFPADMPKETLLSQALKSPRTFDLQRFNPYSAYYVHSNPDSRTYASLNRNNSPIELRLWYICSPMYGCTGRGALPINPNDQLGEFAFLLPPNLPKTQNLFPPYLIQRQNIISPNLFPSLTLAQL